MQIFVTNVLRQVRGLRIVKNQILEVGIMSNVEGGICSCYTTWIVVLPPKGRKRRNAILAFPCIPGTEG